MNYLTANRDWYVVRQGRLNGFMAAIILLVPIIAFAFGQIDLSGWWASSDGNFIEIDQQGADLTLLDPFGSVIAIGQVSNDSVFIFVDSDTLIFMYAGDSLSGPDPDGNPVVLTRLAGTPWISVPCGTIFVDGDTTDWLADFLVVDDPVDDGIGNLSTEIDKFFLCHDRTYLYIRIDLVGDATFPHSGQDNDRYSVRFYQQYHYELYTIDYWEPGYVRLRNWETGQEYTLEPAGVFGNVIESRVPLAWIGDLQKVQVEAWSEYWHGDDDWGNYDMCSVLGEQADCVCGDEDASGETNLTDVVYLVNWIFLGGSFPRDGRLGNVDCSGRTNLVDIIYLMRYLFGGPAPCAKCP